MTTLIRQTRTFLLLAVLAGAPAAVCAAEPPPGWRLHDPLVLAHYELSFEEPGNSLEATDAVWLAGKPVISMWHASRELVLWREDRPGVWVRWSVLEGLSRNSHLAVHDDALYVAGRISGRSERTDAGSIHIWRVSLEGEVVFSQLVAERRANGQWELGHLGAFGNQLVLWLRQPGATHRELVSKASQDGGRTWRPLFDKSLGAEPMAFQVVDRLPLVMQAADEAGGKKPMLGVFVCLEAAPQRPLNMLWRSADGANWQQKGVEFHDDLGPGVARVALNAASVDGELWTTYLARRGAEAELFLARSADGGETWTRGVSIDKGHLQPTRSTFVRARQFVALSGCETRPNDVATGRLTVSHDLGQTWNSLPLAAFYRGPLSSTWALAASPADDRLIVGSVIKMPADDGGRAYFTVQEYSTRATPGLNSSLQALVARKLADLGADNYNTRHQASRDLEALGRQAKDPLLAAYRTAADPEVRQRLKVILAKMYPPCLQVR